MDEKNLSAVLNSVNQLTSNDIEVDALAAMGLATNMDEETQRRFTVIFSGQRQEILLHVWREQVDWLHLYFSSASPELVAAIEQATASFARSGGS